MKRFIVFRQIIITCQDFHINAQSVLMKGLREAFNDGKKI